MTRALVHAVGPALARCELTYVARQPIDLARAAEQHAEYCATLAAHGVDVEVVNVSPEHPDAVFVEDTAIVLDEIAIATSMGTGSRRGEVERIVPLLERALPVVRIEPPARIEGGDVLRIERTLYVGLSQRTDAAGIAALTAIVGPHGFRVVPVPVYGCLHLKTACTAIDARTVLVNPDWLDTRPFLGLEQVPVPSEEPFGANTLPIGDTVLVSESHPRTADLLHRRGHRVRPVDIGELEKAEAGLTCLSLLFRSV